MKRMRMTAAICAALMLTAVPAVPLTPMMETATISVHAEDTEKLIEGDYTYNVDANGNATITKYNGEGGAVTIPSTLGGKPVTVIGEDAFKNCTGLTAVTIPEGVKAIGDEAFRYCSSLTSVTFPGSVTVIGGWAFDDTPWLAAQHEADPLVIVNGILIDDTTCEGDVTIPEGVTTIGGLAFQSCTSLTSIVIPESVTVIGKAAFAGCKSLASLTIPESVTSIGDYAFSGCESLASLTIPKSVTEIGDDAFSNCPDLTLSVYKDSYAQTYAEENSIPYVLIDESTPETPTDAPAPAYGDIDENGAVSIMDVILLNKSLLGGATLSDAAKANADVDKSGEIDTTDALNVLKAVVKLVTLPV